MNWTADGPACRSRCVSGSATLTMKKSSREVKTPASRTGRAPREGPASIRTSGGAMAVAIGALLIIAVTRPRARHGAAAWVARGRVRREPCRGTRRPLRSGRWHPGPARRTDHHLVAEVPGEPGGVVVGVHRARQPERQPGELALHGGDGRVDLVPAGGDRDRVGVDAVRRPQLVDGLPAGRRVGLVPGLQVAGNQVADCHLVPPSVCVPAGQNATENGSGRNQSCIGNSCCHDRVA